MYLMLMPYSFDYRDTQSTQNSPDLVTVNTINLSQAVTVPCGLQANETKCTGQCLNTRRG